MPAGDTAQLTNLLDHEPVVPACGWRSVKCCTLFFSFFRLQLVLDPAQIGMRYVEGATVALVDGTPARTACRLFADRTWEVVVEAQIDPAAFPDALAVVLVQGETVWRVDVATLLAEARAEQVNAPLDGFDAAIEAWHTAHGTARAKLLDIGGRARSGGVQRSSCYPGCDVTVLDVIAGPDVDVVADAHELSRHLPAGHFDFALSVAVFEHLAMPWKVAVEIAKVLRPGGLALVSTHQTIGLHDTPWDFFRFSDAAFTALFNRATGFEIVTTGMISFMHVVPRIWMERHRGWEETGGFESASVLVRKVGEPLVDWDVQVSDFLATSYPDSPQDQNPMRIASKLTRMISRSTRTAPEARPVVRIAERFVSPVEALRRVDMPDDLRNVAPGQELDAVVMDESGSHCRRVRIAPPPPGRTGSRIEFAAIPILPQAVLWLFVIHAGHDDGTVTPALVNTLLQHGRRLEGRPPINLTWDTDPAAPLDPAVSDSATLPTEITFAMLSEEPDPALLPPLDQPNVDMARLTPEQRAWRQDGVVVLRNFFPASVLDPYIDRRIQLNQPLCWQSPTPYLQVEEMRQICLYPPLRSMLRELIGEEMLLHLCLSTWVSTERNWHQDAYLNPPFVGGWYVAVWIALDHIDPDSGPFEYIPGSHRWPVLDGDKVRSFMTSEERDIRVLDLHPWPKITEHFVVPAIEAEIRDRGAMPRFFLAEKGDALIWHSRLMHRGTTPNRPNLERRALIAHYSGVNHRPDMLLRNTDAQGGAWAVFDTPLY